MTVPVRIVVVYLVYILEYINCLVDARFDWDREGTW